MSAEFPASITVDEQPIGLHVERKAVKHINARLRAGVLSVSIPVRLSRAEALPIITDLARRLLRRQRARQVNHEDDALALARRVARRFPAPPLVDSAEFTTITSACWGSYSTRTRSIRLNAALRHMPGWVLEAVMAHELAHAFHPDHSPAFWALLREVYPDTDRADAFLAGVTWLAHSWEDLPPVERAQLRKDEG